MPKNIFLTGAPSSGKTTVIKKVIQKLRLPISGFYTKAVKVGDRRVGFLMKSLDGRKGYLAHQDISSPFKIRRYGVSIENIESIAVPSIKLRENAIVILDEIGKMECFSRVFMKAATEVLNAENIVLGTITLGGDDFIKAVKQRDDLELIEVTIDNRDGLPDLLVRKITALWV
ncbi:MAG: hypothetical protein JXA79_11105 [Deltaproteobacteria bacterium]|nr:hypothetical protein [Deltaproteobacteria bacterium]